jgi:hypothetical protein
MDGGHSVKVSVFDPSWFDSKQRHQTTNGGCYDTAKRKNWKRCKPKIVGKTTDGKDVVSGYDIFKWTESIGLPLDVIVELYNQRNTVIDWIEFVQTSLLHSWKYSNTLLKIQMSLSDVYDDRYSSHVVFVLNKVFEKYG